MDRETANAASLFLLAVLTAGWLAYAGWTVAHARRQDAELRRWRHDLTATRRAHPARNGKAKAAPDAM